MAVQQSDCLLWVATSARVYTPVDPDGEADGLVLAVAEPDAAVGLAEAGLAAALVAGALLVVVLVAELLHAVRANPETMMPRIKVDELRARWQALS